MNWFKFANNDNLIKKIKHILKSSHFIRELMNSYHIPLADIDNNLTITIKPLDGKFAEGNGNEIFLDNKLFKNNNFFEDNFHFVVHEFFHWIKRRVEERCYFNDEEEVQSFILAISWELLNGKGDNDIEKSIFPIIKSHYQCDKKSQKVFLEMLGKAHQLCKNIKNVKGS